MKILVLSDSHGRDNIMREVIRKEEPDYVFHLGDAQEDPDTLEEEAGCPVFMIAGNCDVWTELPDERVVELGGHRFFLTHGHHYGLLAMGTAVLEEAAIANRCDVVLFGHTHMPMMDESRPGLLILNPGSITYPRQASMKPSYIVLEINENGKLRYSLTEVDRTKEKGKGRRRWFF